MLADAGSIALVLTQVITFLGVVAGLYVALVRDARTRQWQKEDRDYLAAQTGKSAEDLAMHTESVSNNLRNVLLEKARGVDEHLKLLQDEIEATKRAAHEAYTEANNVNQKLAAIGVAQAKVTAESVTAAVNAILQTPPSR